MYYKEKIIDGWVYCQNTPNGEWNKIRIATIEERYPELAEISNRIAKTAIDACNKQTKGVKSEMPYKAQCVLEMVIKKLEACV
jgi:hypothetical protein